MSCVLFIPGTSVVAVARPIKSHTYHTLQDYAKETSYLASYITVQPGAFFEVMSLSRCLVFSLGSDKKSESSLQPIVYVTPSSFSSNMAWGVATPSPLSFSCCGGRV